MTVSVVLVTLAMEHIVKVCKYLSQKVHFRVFLSSSDIDECTSDNDTCHINATCINTVGSYDCECLSGFMGDGFNCSSECLTL